MATYDLKYPGAAIDAILDTAYDLQNAGYIFRGLASEYSNTPTERSWVLAGEGETGHGFTSPIPKGYIGVCVFNGTSWTGKLLKCVSIDSTPTSGSTNSVSSGGAYTSISQLADTVNEALDNLTFTDTTPSAFQDEYINMKVSTTEGGVERILTYLTILAATTSKAGLLSAADKVKIDSFLTNLRSLTFADTTASADQATQITETLKATIGGVQEVIDSITLLAATSSKAGLLSASDKAYIDALPATLTSLSNSISGALALMQSLVGYYVCDTAAATAAKTVTATGYTLTNGGCIRIKMTNANTAANVTLNINSTGAKALYYDGTQASSTNTWEAGEVLEVYYDGTQYQCASGGGGKFATGEKVRETSITDEITPNSDDLPTSGAVAEETDNLKANIGYFTCDTAAATAAKVVAATGYKLTTGGNLRIKMTNANTANNVTLNINSTGAKALYYNGVQASESNSWESGDLLEVFYDGTRFQSLSLTGITREIGEIESTLYGTRTEETIIFTSGYIKTDLAIGSTVDLTPKPTSGTTEYAIIQVSTADQLLLNVVGGNASRAWAFVDASDNLLAVADANTTLTNYTLSVPVNATKAIINTDSSSTSYVIRNANAGLFIKSSDLEQTAGSASDKAVSQAAIFVTEFTIDTTPNYYINTGLSVGATVDLTPLQSSSYIAYAIIDCENVIEFIINAKGGSDGRAWAFVDGDNKLLSVSASNATVSNLHLNVPNNAAKCIIQNKGDGVSYYRKIGNNITSAYVTDNLGNSNELIMTQKGVQQALFGETTIVKTVDFTTATKLQRMLIDNNGKWSESTEPNAYGIIVPTVPNSTLHLESNQTKESYFSILKSADVEVGQNADFATGESGRRTLPASNSIDIILPSDAYYLYVYCVGLNSTVYTPSNVTLTEHLIDLVTNSGYEPSTNSEMVIPADVTVLNVERLSHQFADVVYTTKGAIFGAGGTTISAGTKVGLPYTSCMEVDKFVGFDVSLKTFMTCVNNPYSLLYTENLYAGTSGYGFVYHGGGGSSNIGGYMGIVCNVFATHGIGMRTRYDTGSDAYLAKIGVFDKIYNQSAQGLHIGDVWWEQGHNRLITNLWRSNRGLITKIEMSESVHNFPKVSTYDPDAFDELMDTKHAIIYRYNDLYKNINYEASPFVAVEDEIITTPYDYNNDICTFAGDYASFREGQIIYLNYNLASVGSWTSIELTKGNTVIGTYPIDITSHRYDLTSLNLTHGLYKARMKDGSGNYSDYTYFEIIDTSVTYTAESGNNKRITFASTQGEAIYLDVCDLGGRPKAKYQFTSDELEDGYAVVNISELVEEQYDNIVTGETYIKVSFQGEYGRVCSDYLLTDL